MRQRGGAGRAAGVMNGANGVTTYGVTTPGGQKPKYIRHAA